MQLPESEPTLGEGFSLDTYRNLLERLQDSKSRKERVEKKIPAPEEQSPV